MVRVHRVRLPAQEHDGLAAPRQAIDLREHALLGGFAHLEAAQAEHVPVDHPLDQAVAVVAGLDPVDLAVERVLVRGDVGEVGDAQIGGGLVHGERVLRALEVRAHRVDGARLAVGGDVGLHRRHPVAEEHVHVARGHRGVGHRHRQELHVGLVAERVEHDGGRGRGRGDVGPAHVGEHDIGAGVVRVGERGGGEEGQQGGGEQGLAHGRAPLIDESMNRALDGQAGSNRRMSCRGRE